MKYIKIYGTPRSGTNHLKFVLENNFKDVKVFLDILGVRLWPYHENIDWAGRDWTVRRKIGERDITINKLLDVVDDGVYRALKEKKVCYIVTLRHPCASYLSRLRQRFNGDELKNALSQTIGVFWYTLYWNAIHWNWIEQFMKRIPNRSKFVKHENMVSNFNYEMDSIRNKFCLIKKNEIYQDIGKKLNSSGTDYDIKPCFEKHDYDSKYDDKEFYMSMFSKNVIDEFKKYLNDELMNIFGYSI